MSVETPKVEESAPVVSKAVEATPAPVATETPVAEPVAATTTEEPTATESTSAVPTTAETAAKDEAVVEAVPASEGTLGYKGPGFLKQFRYAKFFFWFHEAPSSRESLAFLSRAEKPEVYHSSTAWAQETGKGVLFYSKRAEDRAAPTGMILLSEAGNVTKVGADEFSFKIATHTHKFEAATTAERDSWVVAIEKEILESKAIKDEITGRESYKKTIEDYAHAAPFIGAAVSGVTRSHSKGAAKSLEPAAASTTAPEPVVKKDEVASLSSSDEAKKTEQLAKKDRSQSRKRNSIFGMLGKKEEEKEVKKEEKSEHKAEKKAEKEEKKIEKEHIREEKKIEAEHKKEEAKAEHDANRAKEAAEAAAIAAVPAAAIVAAEKKEEKPEERTEVPTAAEKRAKRGSVFGSLFGKKDGVKSPTVEKSEKEVMPVTATTTSDIPPVSETAPKLDEPTESKPLDAAAVTAPAETTTETSAIPATTAEPTAETAAVPAAVETTTSPKTEKKSFLAGLIKKVEKKEEPREVKQEEKAAEEISKDPMAAAAVEPTTETTATEAPTAITEAPKEERPAREKRRTSLFGALGTMKRKEAKSPSPVAATTEESTLPVTDAKREKSPLPSKIGGLFRKPSKAVKPSEATKDLETTPPSTTATTIPETGAAVTNGETTGAPSTTIIEPTESKIVGDIVPDVLHGGTFHDAVTTEPAEVKAAI